MKSAKSMGANVLSKSALSAAAQFTIRSEALPSWASGLTLSAVAPGVINGATYLGHDVVARARVRRVGRHHRHPRTR